MTLTDDQNKALAAVLKWAKTPSVLGSVNLGYIIKGWAGTGKTTLLKLIAQSLPDCVLCAPTNKAVKVLKALGTGSHCCTIYSLLGLQMEEREDKLQLVKAEHSKVGRYKYVLLDEASMVNSILLPYIKESMSTVRYLFIGDPMQLNPVGEERSPVWDLYESSVLKEVVRHDNQILNFATHIRSVKRLSDIKIKTDHDGQQGVWYVDPNDFERMIGKAALRGDFYDLAKCLAWRNRTVEEMNRLIRKKQFGLEATKHKCLPEEKIVFTSPVNDDDLKIYVDDEAEIKRIETSTHPEYPELQVYHLTIQLDDQETRVMALHEVSDKQYDKLLNNLAQDARRPGEGKLWRKFWGLKNSMVYFKHAYALTVHRSQGSTIPVVYVDAEDILCNRNRIEAKRCFYVAVTRPSQKLIIC